MTEDLPTLADLRRQFPQFMIWREVTGQRTRYIARRARTGIHPHTVVTADIAELRAVLAASAPPPNRLDRPPAGSVPTIAHRPGPARARNGARFQAGVGTRQPPCCERAP